MFIRGIRQVLMAPKGEGEDGGGDTTTIDDNDTTTGGAGEDTLTGVDRGDEVEAPLDPEALKRVAGDDTTEGGEGADTTAQEGGKKGSTHVPIGRFNEVNEKAKRLEREVSELKKAAAPSPAPAPTPTPPPKPVFDEDKAELEYANLLAEGEFDKAVAKRKEINANLREQARDEAERNVESRREVRETVQTLTDVATQAVKDFPYLDTEEGAPTMDLIIAARDGFAAKGIPMPEALKKAVDQIAPKFAPAKVDPPGKDSTTTTTGEDTRSQQANARGAGDSTKQPPKLDGGAGNRATQGKVAVEDLTEEQFDALPASEKKRLRGDEG